MKIPVVETDHLLSVTDLTREEILSLFDFTCELKQALKKGRKHHLLPGKTLAMIFEKSSTRTRVSFETGIYQLGGMGMFLSSNDIQLGRGETIADTARVLSRYVDGIMIRTFEQDKVDELARFSDIPIINGLTDLYHPCQALTDYFTIYEYYRDFSGKKLTYIGDGNNMCNSLLLCGALLGMDVSVACPKRYSPSKDVIEQTEKIAQESGSRIVVTADINEATKDADFVYTDVWTSMGQEKETILRRKAFKKYKITMSLLRECAPEARIMHCLPAHRGEEIDNDVIESTQSIVFDQAENRLHVQKAIMCALMGKNIPPQIIKE